MSDVLLLSHLGIRCAVPSRQVIGAEEWAGGHDPIELWPLEYWPAGLPEPPPQMDRLIEVQTGVGPKFLRCSQVRLGRIAPTSVWQLSPLLEDALDLPHVVGLAELDDALLWLVDLQRFNPRSEKPESVESKSPTLVLRGSRRQDHGDHGVT
ncbi:MAG: hypothetical protein JW751_22100 [Polyangiaceae bacterium]|nr:hypothetical protein [Polyangiaceae bacterium]